MEDDIDHAYLHDARPMGDLARSACAGDASEVRRLLASVPGAAARCGVSKTEADPLLVGCERRHVEVVEALLDAGAPLGCRAWDVIVRGEPESADLAHLALIHGRTGSFGRVAICVDVFQTEFTWSIQYAARHRRFGLVELLLQIGQSDVCLIESADRVSGVPECREEYLLLRHALGSLVLTPGGSTKGNALFHIQQDVDLIEEVIDRGAEVDQTIESGRSVLYGKSPRATATLLAHGANANGHGESPLFGLCSLPLISSPEDAIESFEMLVHAGADVFAHPARTCSERVADSFCKHRMLSLLEQMGFLGAMPDLKAAFQPRYGTHGDMPFFAWLVELFGPRSGSSTSHYDPSDLDFSLLSFMRRCPPMIELLLAEGCAVAPCILSSAFQGGTCHSAPRLEDLDLMLYHFEGDPVSSGCLDAVSRLDKRVLGLVRDLGLLLPRFFDKEIGYKKLHKVLSWTPGYADSEVALEIIHQSVSACPESPNPWPAFTR